MYRAPRPNGPLSLSLSPPRLSLNPRASRRRPTGGSGLRRPSPVRMLRGLPGVARKLRLPESWDGLSKRKWKRTAAGKDGLFSRSSHSRLTATEERFTAIRFVSRLGLDGCSLDWEHPHEPRWGRVTERPVLRLLGCRGRCREL